MVNGGSVDTGSTTILGGHHGVDVSQIAFGAQTTLAYAEAGGTLAQGDDRHAAAITVLGNYMAASFVATADGHGGALLTQVGQTGQQPLLTHPVP